MPKLYSAIAALVLCFVNIFTSGAQCNPPATPLGKTLLGTGTTASINWIPVTGAVSYDYYIGLYPATPPSTSVTTAGTTVTFSGLTPHTKYEVCVRTNCSGGSSAWVCDTFTTIVAPPFCPQPSNVTANATGPHNIITGWIPVGGAVSYEYYLSTSPTPTPTGDTTIYQGIALSGLKSLGTYYFCVRTRCGGNNSSFWMCDTVYTPAATNVDDTKDAPGPNFFPNPVSDILHLDMVKERDEILLTNVYGNTVYQWTAARPGKHEIDMSSYPVGLYLLTFRTPIGTHSYKLQKQ